MVAINSCKKEKGTNPTELPAPVISSFAPLAAAKDSLVTITGANFSTTPSENEVSFGNIKAIILQATVNSLTVKVPLHAADGKIAVTVKGKTANSADNFSYIYTATTLAGGQYGFKDGPDTTAQFFAAFGLTTDADGNIIVADGGNNRIRKITPQGVVSTIAGTGAIGYKNGPKGEAMFNYPRGVAVDGAGNIYVADAGNNRIRKISVTGEVSTLAGDGTDAYKDGPGNEAQFNFPVELVVDKNGNVFVTDGGNSCVRKITPQGVVTTIGTRGFGFPEGIAIDKDGNLFIADPGFQRIFKMTPSGTNTVFAGTGTIGLVDGPANTAKFKNPEGIAIDKQGNLYVGDLGNAAVRKITPDGIVSTLVGGTRGSEDGAGTKARFNEPSGLYVDIHGNIYLADAGNSKIRRIE
jgi:sugar lactone lactonase YvrE